MAAPTAVATRSRGDSRAEALSRLRGRARLPLIAVPAGGLVDGVGNRSGAAVTVTVGSVAAADWPGHLGVGGGRSPGPFGEGSFPP